MKNYTIVVTHNIHLFHISEFSNTYTCTQNLRCHLQRIELCSANVQCDTIITELHAHSARRDTSVWRN